jgi:hypothetical protein
MAFVNLLFVKKIDLSFLLLFITSYTFSQGLMGYEDFRRNFVVFDDGIIKTLEIQPVLKYGVGGKCIPYIDNLGYFKIYNNKKVHQVNYGANIDFIATDNLVSYFFNEQLWVFENGEKHLLSIWARDFKVSDYTIAYTDNNNNSFNVYQAGQIIKIEDVMSGVNELNYKVGENIVAYNFLNSFNVFYNGHKEEITFNNPPSAYEVGRNIVAYTNPQQQTFNAYYNGQIYKLEDFQPTWFRTGDNMILYKDQLNNLKIFYNGEVKNLSNFEVTNIDIEDNICTFVEQGQFRVFFKGEVKTLEYYTPTVRILDNNTVLYLDQNNLLKYFDGKTGVNISSERVSNFGIYINTIKFENSGGQNRIFYKGKIYQ